MVRLPCEAPDQPVHAGVLRRQPPCCSPAAAQSDSVTVVVRMSTPASRLRARLHTDCQLDCTHSLSSRVPPTVISAQHPRCAHPTSCNTHTFKMHGGRITTRCRPLLQYTCAARPLSTGRHPEHWHNATACIAITDTLLQAQAGHTCQQRHPHMTTCPLCHARNATHT
jgi:hypothetical protein